MCTDRKFLARQVVIVGYGAVGRGIATGLLVVTASESTNIRPMIETARTLNPDIPVIVRAPNAEEAALLLAEGAHKAVHAKGAVAQAMLHDVLGALAASRAGAGPGAGPGH
jgi:CPA2 family monovalent cation:H+ antiporter-2